MSRRQFNLASLPGFGVGVTALAILLALAITGGGWFYYEHQVTVARHAAREALATIADLKAQDIANWMKERRGDAEVARVSLIFKQVLTDPNSLQAREQAAQRVRPFREVYDYAAVILTDPSGRIEFKDPPDFPVRDSSVANRIQLAHSSTQVVLSDLNRDQPGDPIYLWLICPVGTDQASGHADGAVLLVIDPKTFLYPTVEKWPTPSRTAETTLVRREGNSVVFLCNLRHATNALLRLSFPITPDSQLPAAKAAQGIEGVMDGVDYAGTPVLAATRRIAGSPWFMVAKIDQDEVLAPLRQEAREVTAITASLLLATVLAVGLLWRQQKLVYLRASETRFRTLIEKAPAAMSISRAGKTIYVNQKYREIYGFGNEDNVTGQLIIEQWAPEFRAVVMERVRRREAGEPVPAEYEGLARRKDGSHFPVHCAVTRLELPDGPAFLAVLTDVTERKRHEDHIRKLNRMYAALSGVNQLIVREKNRQTTLDAACRIAVELGEFRMAWIGMEDAAAHVLQPVASAGDVEGYLETLAIIVNDMAHNPGPSGKALKTAEHRICNDIENDPDMQPWRAEALRRGYLASAAFPLRVDDKVVGVFTLYAADKEFFDADEVRLLDELAADIGFALEVYQRENNRRLAEQALEASERQFSSAFEFASIGKAIVGLDGRFLKVNRSLCRMVGYTPEELCARTFQDVTHPDDLGRDLDKMRQILGGEIDVFQLEKRYIHKDGHVIWISLSVSLVRDEHGQPLHFLPQIQDITERRQIEEQLRQAQKMEAIGQLAGGVAHDFNNILTAILLQTQILARAAKGAPEILNGLVEIRMDSERAANLTRQLLVFSRKQVMQMSDVNLNELVTRVANMLQRLIGEDIHMQLLLDSAPLVTHADPGMLDQVLLNLAVNARDAMPQGGRLIISTTKQAVQESDVPRDMEAAPGCYVCIGVSDTGTGISLENLPHVFEPFFTTKEPGKGTGLGLATVFGIVRQHRGFLKVASKTGLGTNFQVFLPAAQIVRSTPPADDRPESLGGNETILFVEDEDRVRSLVGMFLKQSGYRVFDCSSGSQALELWQEHRARIELLLTDMVMPGGVSGKDLAARLRQDAPKLKVIFTSGYSAEVAGRKMELKRGEYFLRKPFPPEKLLAAIRQCLDQEDSPP